LQSLVRRFKGFLEVAIGTFVGEVVSKGFGKNTSPKSVRFDDDSMWVSLSDGRSSQ
jgi:hypothetical protein